MIVRADKVIHVVIASVSISVVPRYSQPTPRETDTMHMLRQVFRGTFCRQFSTMTETLVPLPAVEKLSSRVIRVLGGNPSKVSFPGRPRRGTRI